MSQHDEYQQRCLTWTRRTAELPEGTIQQVVAALIEKNYWADATELLFGTKRRGEFLEMDRMGWSFYLFLWTGRFPDVLRAVAENYHWSDKFQNEGLCIQVYPGEYFVVEEPTATRALETMR